ncbi:hypothetical protein WKH56_20520 [Priestia sp. SB1]
MKVYVFVRIADSCRIETYILSDQDEKWEDVWEDLVTNGSYKLSNVREF